MISTFFMTYYHRTDRYKCMYKGGEKLQQTTYIVTKIPRLMQNEFGRKLTDFSRNQTHICDSRKNY